MNLAWLTAVSKLEQKPDHGVYVLVGDEPALMRQFIALLCERLSDDPAQPLDVQRYRFDESGCDEALLACQSYSLFGALPIVVLEQCTAFLASGKSKWDTGPLEAYLAEPIPGRTLVITVYGDKLDERKKLTKLLKDHRVVLCHASKPEEAMQILSDFAMRCEIRCEPDAMQEIWRRTNSISIAQQELQKVHAYVNGGVITKRDVAELVSTPMEDNVFQWIDGVMAGDVRRAFQVLFEVQLAGYDALAMLALIARQLRLMGYTLWLGPQGVPQAQIASRCGAHPYAVKVAADQARRVGLT
ncbi:MAG: DNA polymerase III subunit delta, partial [Alicyclobacillus sp.]|nr:DNA polymerase III subunit delta [Alicyclobacillus sp.]